MQHINPMQKCKDTNRKIWRAAKRGLVGIGKAYRVSYSKTYRNIASSTRCWTVPQDLHAPLRSNAIILVQGAGKLSCRSSFNTAKDLMWYPSSDPVAINYKQ